MSPLLHVLTFEAARNITYSRVASK